METIIELGCDPVTKAGPVGPYLHKLINGKFEEERDVYILREAVRKRLTHDMMEKVTSR